MKNGVVFLAGKISRAWADLSMVFVACIWGVTFVIVKNALADIGPFLFVGLRFLLAFLLLAALSYKDIPKIRFSTLTTGSLLGFFMYRLLISNPWPEIYHSSNAGFITGVSVVLVP